MSIYHEGYPDHTPYEASATWNREAGVADFINKVQSLNVTIEATAEAFKSLLEITEGEGVSKSTHYFYKKDLK